MAKRSLTLMEKLDAKLTSAGLTQPRLQINTIVDLDDVISLVQMPGGFGGQRELENTLDEGMILNINKLVSGAIQIPHGEYIVHSIIGNKATLVPTESITGDVASRPASYEVLTSKLLGNWDKLSRALSEDLDSDEHERPLGDKENIQNSTSIYPRNKKVKGAFEASGSSQEEIASHCGVHPSQISRITASGGKGARKPSLELAMCVAHETGQTVEQLFGNLPGNKKRTANTGSGDKGDAKNPTYNQGNNQ